MRVHEARKARHRLGDGEDLRRRQEASPGGDRERDPQRAPCPADASAIRAERREAEGSVRRGVDSAAVERPGEDDGAERDPSEAPAGRRGRAVERAVIRAEDPGDERVGEVPGVPDRDLERDPRAERADQAHERNGQRMMKVATREEPDAEDEEHDHHAHLDADRRGEREREVDGQKRRDDDRPPFGRAPRREAPAPVGIPERELPEVADRFDGDVPIRLLGIPIVGAKRRPVEEETGEERRGHAREDERREHCREPGSYGSHAVPETHVHFPLPGAYRQKSPARQSLSLSHSSFGVWQK